MGVKKAKQLNNNDTMAWPDLPDQLITLISKKLHLLDHVHFDGIAKRWRSSSKKCNSNRQLPWLELSVESVAHNISQVYSIPELPWINAWWNRRYNNRLPHDPVIGSSHGHIVMRSSDSFGHFIFFPPNGTQGLPHLDPNIPFRHIVFSWGYDHKTIPSSLVLTGSNSKPGPMFYCARKSGKHEWVKVQCSQLSDPNSSNPNSGTIEFTNAVALNGKFYALSLQGTLAVIDIDADENPTATILGVTRAIPSVSPKCFKEYLIESQGEILLIFLISRKSFREVNDIEVFRLDFTKMTWRKIENLGSRTLFIGLNCCMSINASELGYKENCIYFRQDMNDDQWWEFNIREGKIGLGINLNLT